MARKRKKSRKVWIILVVVVLLAAGGGFLLSRRGADRNGSGRKSELPDIKTVKVEKGDVEVMVREIGTIEPAVKVEVKSNLVGKVTDIFVREGDEVVKSQNLAVVEPEINQARTLTQIRSALRRADIQLQDAERDFENKEQLFQEGFGSSEEVRLARVRLDEAKNSWQSAKQDYDIVEASGIPMGGGLMAGKEMNIETPMQGVVLKVNVERGEMVTSTSSFNSGTVLFEVADIGSMLIRASINEVDIGKVKKNQNVRIKVDAFPRTILTGSVSYISPAAEQATGMQGNIKVFNVEVTIDDYSVELRSGMTATIEIMGEKREGVLTVPVEALFQKDDNDVVYVRKSETEPPEDNLDTASPDDNASDATADKRPPGKRSSLTSAMRSPRRVGSRVTRKARPGRSQETSAKAGEESDPAPWQKEFEEREVKVGLADLKLAEILEGLAEGEEIAVENPVLDGSSESSMRMRFH